MRVGAGEETSVFRFKSKHIVSYEFMKVAESSFHKFHMK